MKKLILIITLYIPILGIAQKPFIIEGEVPTESVPVNSWIIGITDDFDDAIDNYKDYVKEEFDLKVKKSSSICYEITEVNVPHLSIKRGDLKTYLFQTDSMNILAFSFLLGYDIHVNSEDYPEEMAEFKKFVIRYMEFHYKAFYDEKIDAKDKELDKLKKELKQNEDKVSSLKKKSTNLGEKEAKEDDEGKKNKIVSDKREVDSEIDQMVNLLPDMRNTIQEKEKEIFGLKEELNQYHQAITTL